MEPYDQERILEINNSLDDDDYLYQEWLKQQKEKEEEK